MRDAGFSLIETLIATFLLAVSLSALAQLFAIAVTNNAVARHGTIAAVLAAQKIEQLRGDASLAPSPANALRENVPGYSDDVDRYRRRWTVEPVPGTSALVIQVLVTRRHDRGGADAGAVTRAPEEARLITIARRRP